MGDVVGIDGKPVKQTKVEGVKMQKKPTKKQELELRVASLEQHISETMREMFQINANGVALFQALKQKGVVEDKDIEDAWAEHVAKPYEEAKKAQAAQESGIIMPNKTIVT